VGSGSGILCLAALARGASWTVGVEIDAQAVWVARQIAEQQEHPCRPDYVIGEVASIGASRFDLILCNMIVEHFRPFLPTLGGHMERGGQLVLSGMLNSQVASVRREAETFGFIVQRERRLEDWTSVRFGRR
jgi:ribosomal protein L11 methyltransferase